MRALGFLEGRQGREGGLLRWRRAVAGDIPALSAFLQEDEERRVGFSGRLLKEGSLPAAALRLPSPLRGNVWIAEARAQAAPALEGAVLCHPSRLAFPVFPPGDCAEGLEGDRELALLVSAFAPASVIGMASDVGRYEAALGLVPQTSVAYRLMTQKDRTRPRPSGHYPQVQSLRRAEPADLDALMPLQEAYEREEVLTPIHNFNAAACRASLARALERQLIFVAEESGVIVGKAGTNARGFGVDQIGGVYTLPSRRGRGIASGLMDLLLAEIRSAGRRPALFVKPANRPAIQLYEGLGFEDLGDYRADYFEL